MAHNVFVQAYGASTTLTVDFLPDNLGVWNVAVKAYGATTELVVDSWSGAAASTVCKVYNGTAWVIATPKVYDGTQWVVATAKVRDSSGWV